MVCSVSIIFRWPFGANSSPGTHPLGQDNIITLVLIIFSTFVTSMRTEPTFVGQCIILPDFTICAAIFQSDWLMSCLIVTHCDVTGLWGRAGEDSSQHCDSSPLSSATVAPLYLMLLHPLLLLRSNWGLSCWCCCCALCIWLGLVYCIVPGWRWFSL